MLLMMQICTMAHRIEENKDEPQRFLQPSSNLVIDTNKVASNFQIVPLNQVNQAAKNQEIITQMTSEEQIRELRSIVHEQDLMKKTLDGLIRNRTDLQLLVNQLR